MKRSGTADLPLDGGRVPAWLATRMTALGAAISESIIHHHGRSALLPLAVDDHSWIAYIEVLGDQLGPTCAALVTRAVAWFRARGMVVRRVLSDNGSGYVSGAFPTACTALAVRHRRARLYAADQGQGRALHSNASPRMGVCGPVRHVARPAPSVAPFPVESPQTRSSSRIDPCGPTFRPRPAVGVSARAERHRNAPMPWEKW